MIKDLNDCKTNKHKRYCFEAEEKKFKKIIAHNGLETQNFQNMTKDNKQQELSNSTDTAIAYSTCYVQPFSEVFNEDCIQVMKRYPDKFFDLAVVDPPYGIGMSKIKKWSTSKKCLAKSNNYKQGDWDNNIPDEEYFIELMRVSKNQIIWGGNYYAHILPASSAWIVWDKENDGTKTADCEMAWTSFKSAARLFRWMWRGFLQDGEAEKKIHICQKPVKLYEWVFLNYAKEGQNILDTHLGSASSRIAAHNMKMNFVGCEVDVDHFNHGEARFKEFVSQLRLF